LANGSHLFGGGVYLQKIGMLGKTLVTGATGFIGQEVARVLADRGERPRVLIRRDSRARFLDGIEAERVPGRLEDATSLGRAAAGCDTVIHLAARAVIEEYRRMQPSIVAGTAAMMRAARDAGVRTFVFASSLLVYSQMDGPIDEATLPLPATGYGQAKLEAELELIRVGGDAGMAVGVLRLPHVYGGRDLVMYRALRGLVALPRPTDQPIAHMHVKDVARALVAAAEIRYAGALPIGDDRPAPWLEFVAELHRQLPTFRQLIVPAPLVAGALHLFTPLRLLSRHPSLYTPQTVRSLREGLAVVPGLVRERLGMELLHPTLASGIAASLDRFRRAAGQVADPGWIPSPLDHSP
jgi:UDP-glucose 4-epimerase